MRRDFVQREITELVGVEHGERRPGDRMKHCNGGRVVNVALRDGAGQHPRRWGIAERIRLTAKRTRRTRRYPRACGPRLKVFLGGDWHPVLRDPLDLFRLSFPVITYRGTGHAVHW